MKIVGFNLGFDDMLDYKFIYEFDIISRMDPGNIYKMLLIKVINYFDL